VHDFVVLNRASGAEVEDFANRVCRNVIMGVNAIKDEVVPASRPDCGRLGWVTVLTLTARLFKVAFMSSSDRYLMAGERP
jgi:hypothetical protein